MLIIQSMLSCAQSNMNLHCSFEMSKLGLGVVKLFSHPSQLSMKLILCVLLFAINCCYFSIYKQKMNTTSENFNTIKIYLFQDFRLYEQLKYHKDCSTGTGSLSKHFTSCHRHYNIIKTFFTSNKIVVMNV